MFELSDKQKDIIDCWNNEDYNILINAVAGSGKTSTILKLLEYCKYKTLFVAFNKSVKEEIQTKIDNKGLAQGKAMTIHSLGLMTLRKNYRININSNKNYTIIDNIKTICKKIINSYTWKDKMKIFYLLQDMNDISRLFLTDSIDKIFEIMNTMDKIIPEININHIQELWKEVINQRNILFEKSVKEIDFIDMIYLPVVKSLFIPIDPYYLFIDEAQDLNLCQHKFIDKLLSQGAIHKWIAVGDRNQSIYGFAGAYSSSFDLFLEKGNVKELPLDICYRCDKNIIDSANEVYDVMIPFSKTNGIVSEIDSIDNIKENSMIICRNSGPIIDLYFKLLKSNKPCYIKGDDILSNLLRFLNPYRYQTIAYTKSELEHKRLSLLNKDDEKSKKELYFLEENINNFNELTEHFCSSLDKVETLIEKLKTLFINKENAITLCTIHKSKGLEADVVYILNEYLIPNKFAKSKEQLRQEKNLKYVARTRAKKELYFLDLKKQNYES